MNGVLHHLEAILFFIKMFGNFLRGTRGLRQPTDSRVLPLPQSSGALGYLEQQVVLEDALDGLQQVGAQGQRVLQQRLPVPEELGLLLVPHALGQGGH